MSGTEIGKEAARLNPPRMLKMFLKIDNIFPNEIYS